MIEGRHPTSLTGQTCMVTKEFIEHWNNNCSHPCPYPVGSFIRFDSVNTEEEIPNCGIREREEEGYTMNLSLLPLLGYTLIESKE